MCQRQGGGGLDNGTSALTCDRLLFKSSPDKERVDSGEGTYTCSPCGCQPLWH